MASFRTRVFAVKLLLLDHGELVKALSLDDELVQKNSAPGENIDSEIVRQSAILKAYEDKYSKVCCAAAEVASCRIVARVPQRA
jgi:hypothetical protein